MYEKNINLFNFFKQRLSLGSLPRSVQRKHKKEKTYLKALIFSFGRQLIHFDRKQL